MSDKQQWVYTEDGPELEKEIKAGKIKINKWFFLTPWIILLALIIWAFSSELVGMGILLVILGPLTVLWINYKTFQKIVLGPLRKNVANSKPKIKSKS